MATKSNRWLFSFLFLLTGYITISTTSRTIKAEKTGEKSNQMKHSFFGIQRKIFEECSTVFVQTMKVN